MKNGAIVATLHRGIVSNGFMVTRPLADLSPSHLGRHLHERLASFRGYASHEEIASTLKYFGYTFSELGSVSLYLSDVRWFYLCTSFGLEIYSHPNPFSYQASRHDLRVLWDMKPSVFRDADILVRVRGGT